MIEHRILAQSAAGGTTNRSLWGWRLYLLAGVFATGGYYLLSSTAAQNVFIVLIDASVVVAIMAGIHVHRPKHSLVWRLLPSAWC